MGGCCCSHCRSAMEAQLNCMHPVASPRLAHQPTETTVVDLIVPPASAKRRKASCVHRPSCIVHRLACDGTRLFPSRADAATDPLPVKLLSPAHSRLPAATSQITRAPSAASAVCRRRPPVVARERCRSSPATDSAHSASPSHVEFSTRRHARRCFLCTHHHPIQPAPPAPRAPRGPRARTRVGGLMRRRAAVRDARARVTADEGAGAVRCGRSRD